jgi:hypothetical protein
MRDEDLEPVRDHHGEHGEHGERAEESSDKRENLEREPRTKELRAARAATKVNVETRLTGWKDCVTWVLRHGIAAEQK